MTSHSLITASHVLWSQKDLLLVLIRREISARYKGTFLGISWLIIHPLLLLLVYAFVFGGVFKSRWSTHDGLPYFSAMLFAGLIIYWTFADAVNRAPATITSNASFVKKVVFPLEILPLVTLGTSCVGAIVGVAILIVLLVAIGQPIPWTASLTFLPFVPILLMTAGLAWALAALGVFFRDLAQVVGIVTSLALFLSPVFFPSDAVPAQARWLMQLNPLSYSIEEFRNVLIIGAVPRWDRMVAHLLAGFAVAIGGLWFFQKCRPAFADVV